MLDPFELYIRTRSLDFTLVSVVFVIPMSSKQPANTSLKQKLNEHKDILEF